MEKEVLVPVSILKGKVETDFEEYMFFHSTEDPEKDNRETFPLYESTTKVLEILKAAGIEFDTSTGLWKDQE